MVEVSLISGNGGGEASWVLLLTRGRGGERE